MFGGCFQSVDVEQLSSMSWCSNTLKRLQSCPQNNWAKNKPEKFFFKGVTMASQEDLLKLGKWQNMWDEKNIGWHQPAVNPHLEENLELMTKGKSGLRFLLPLCGKTLDLKWLYDQGHVVVGVEGVENGIIEFWAENDMAYTVEDVPGVDDAKVYYTEDKRLKIYLANFFAFDKFPQEKKFDCIWDRASLVAINPETRTKYRDVILSVMAPGGCYVVETFDFVPPCSRGPPHHITKQIVDDLYDESCHIKELQYVPVDPSSGIAQRADSVFIQVHHLSLK